MINTMNKSVITFAEPTNLSLINLGFFNSSSDILKHISENESGIYAWFRSYNYSTNDDDKFYEELVHDILSPKFYKRTGTVKPYYNVSISSKSSITKTKEEKIQYLIKNTEFKSFLNMALQASILFQTPLYIGKSSKLKNRISQHLQEDSILRERLKSSEIDMDNTVLLLLTDLNNEENITSEPRGDDYDESCDEVYEEIFSRLFSPSFTIRLG